MRVNFSSPLNLKAFVVSSPLAVLSWASIKFRCRLLALRELDDFHLPDLHRARDPLTDRTRASSGAAGESDEDGEGDSEQRSAWNHRPQWCRLSQERFVIEITKRILISFESSCPSSLWK